MILVVWTDRIIQRVNLTMLSMQSTDKTNVSIPAERKGLPEAFKFKSMGLAVLFAGFAFMVLVYPTAAFDEISG